MLFERKQKMLCGFLQNFYNILGLDSLDFLTQYTLSVTSIVLGTCVSATVNVSPLLFC